MGAWNGGGGGGWHGMGVCCWGLVSGVWDGGPRMGDLIWGAWDCRERSKPCSRSQQRFLYKLITPDKTKIVLRRVYNNSEQ